MLSGKSLAFVLVVASAFIHASWNVAAKSLKGNTSILILGTIQLFPKFNTGHY